ncbi:MAG: hypothetical protein KAJ49_05920 [Arcobacteraceae bacterium]|nr:hypothetical protein [Arcobacteraceae bacterium]
MNCEVRIHRGYAEFELLKQEGILNRQMFGMFQFIFSSKKGRISLIQQVNYLHKGDNFWEIFQINKREKWFQVWKKKMIFEDTERFNTRQEAEQKIRELLKNE